MPLENLSPELLLRIIGYVGVDIPYVRGIKDLNRLALCSRQFNALVTPILYQTIACSVTLSHVLHHLLRNQPMGVTTGVKRFITSWLDQDEDTYDMLSMSLFSEADFSTCEKVVKDICSPQEKALEWIEKVRAGHWDAIAGLILALLPNLEDIEMESYGNPGNSHPSDKYICYVLNRAARLQEEHCTEVRGSLAKLRNMRLAYSDTEGGLRFRTIVAFLRPKSIKNITIHMLSDEEFEPESNIFYAENLTLQYSCVEGDCLVRFLGCFPNLKRFAYENGGSVVGFHDFFPHKIGQAISHLKPCLEVLEVTDCDGSGPYGEEDAYPFGSLAEFEKLREITTESEFLLGDPEGALIDEINQDSDEEEDLDPQTKVPREWSLVDVLPKSIQKIVLIECQWKELTYLQELLSRKEEVAPVLEDVELTFKTKHKPDEEEIKLMKKDCKTAGIKFVCR